MPVVMLPCPSPLLPFLSDAQRSWHSPPLQASSSLLLFITSQPLNLAIVSTRANNPALQHNETPHCSSFFL